MAHPYDDRYRGEYRGQRDYGGEERGFLERAGDEVRSWFRHDDAERRRHDEDAVRRERMTPERGWTSGESWQGAERWRNDSDRWRGEPGRWRTEPERGERDMGREYGPPARAWSETGYERSGQERSMPEDRWRAGEESRDYGDRWRRERGGTWGPAAWSQEERWRRESGAGHDDRSRESNWGAWPREDASSSGQRRPGESRGYYEDGRGRTHQFAHAASGRSGGGGMRAGVNYTGRGPKNYRRSDERIREELCDRLTDDWRIDATDVEVAVDNGQVTLAGSVHSRDEKRNAEDLAESIPGVHDVVNQLRVNQWDDARSGGGTAMGTSEMGPGGTTMSTGGPASGPAGTAGGPVTPAQPNPPNATGTRR